LYTVTTFGRSKKTTKVGGYAPVQESRGKLGLLQTSTGDWQRRLKVRDAKNWRNSTCWKSRSLRTSVLVSESNCARSII